MDAAIIDYGLGNVASLQKALKHIGKTSIITKDHDVIHNSRSIFLPGVGSFGTGMQNPKDNKLLATLNKEVLCLKKPFFGICLGMQLLGKKGHEGGLFNGLGWIDAEVIKIKNDGLKVPHMGWNNLKDCKSILCPFEDEDFYFVHSYHMIINESNTVAATVEYGNKLTSAIHKENIFATQFHPEKSQKVGLALMEAFFDYYD